MQAETTYDFVCPYCWQTNQITIDATGGMIQELIVDCENCCSPIKVTTDLSTNSIKACRENE